MTDRSSVLGMVLVLVLSSCSTEHAPGEALPSHGEHAAESGQGTQGAAPAGAGIKGMADVDVSPERRQVTGVRTERIRRQPLEHPIRTVGLVAADERQVRKVQTKISGWVQGLSVNFTGQYVTAGDPILSIYSPELVATQREYLLALEAARSGSGARSAANANDKRTLLESARTRLLFWDLTAAQIAELERSGTPHRMVTLHSPISGYVTLKPVYQGMYVTPEMELYTVTELGTVWIWADIYEDEIGLVRAGQPATISLASAPGAARPAIVSYVNPTIEPATRTLRIRFDVENRDGALKPGMYATVEVEASLGEVLALPGDAVIDTGERKVVFVAIGDARYQPREVRVGRKARGYYEVLGGLADGDQVVVSAQFLLDSESRLRAAAGGPSHAGH